MPFPIYSNNYKTSLITNYYNSNICKSELFSYKNNINFNCKNSDNNKCCLDKLKEIYNKSYKINTCYIIKNKNINFDCENEKLIETIFYCFIILLIILLFLISICFFMSIKDYCRKKKYNTISDKLTLINYTNPCYNT